MADRLEKRKRGSDADEDDSGRRRKKIEEVQKCSPLNDVVVHICFCGLCLMTNLGSFAVVCQIT